MEENKTIDIDTIPAYAELFGTFEDSFEYSPTALFDRFSIPEDKRYTFTLRPLSEKDRAYLQGLLAAHHTEALRRALEAGIDINYIGKDLSTLKLSKRELSKAVADQTLFYKITSDCEPRAEKFSLARRYVIGLENGFALTKDAGLVPLPFMAEEGHDYVIPEVWSKIMPKVKEGIVQKLQDISGLTSVEIQSL